MNKETTGETSSGTENVARIETETAANIQRLGVLGGTFDPLHYGHMLIADTARVQLKLDRVLFSPAGQPPHKSPAQPSPAPDRVAIVQAALSEANQPAFHLSRVDLDRPGPHYTVDALTLLCRHYPAAQIWLLIGGDSLVDLPRWRSPLQIISLARLAVLARPGYEPDLDTIETQLAGEGNTPLPVNLQARIEWLLGPTLDVSSTELRQRARRGFPIRYLVPPSVEDYVRQHNLYKPDSLV